MQAANPIIIPRTVPGAPHQPSMPLREPETLWTHKKSVKAIKKLLKDTNNAIITDISKRERGLGVGSEPRPCAYWIWGSHNTDFRNVTLQSSGGSPIFSRIIQKNIHSKVSILGLTAQSMPSPWRRRHKFLSNVGELLRVHSITSTRHLYSLDSVQFLSVSTVEAAGMYINCFLDVNMLSVTSFIILSTVWSQCKVSIPLTVTSLIWHNLMCSNIAAEMRQ
jgi:hypothetical protein